MFRQGGGDRGQCSDPNVCGVGGDHGYTGPQGGHSGCPDGNNICWGTRFAQTAIGCNAGDRRCALLSGAGQGVLYAYRHVPGRLAPPHPPPSPPPSPNYPPATDVCKGVDGRRTLGWRYGSRNLGSGYGSSWVMCYSSGPGHEICSTNSRTSDHLGKKYTGDEACHECGKCVMNEACSNCNAHGTCANFPNGCTPAPVPSPPAAPLASLPVTTIYAQYKAQLEAWGLPSDLNTSCYQRSVDAADSPTGKGSSTNFHSGCDGKGASLVLWVLDTGYVGGGYATTSWDNVWAYGTGSDNSFLFSLTNNLTFPIRASQLGSAQFHDGSYGPTFGGGHDFYVQGGDMTSTSCNPGFTYACPTGWATDTCGSSSGRCCKALCGVWGPSNQPADSDPPGLNSAKVVDLGVWVRAAGPSPPAVPPSVQLG